MANIISSGLTRKVVYGIYAILSLSTGALHVWFSALKLDDPAWLTGSTAVIAFLASAPLTLALVNVFAPATTEPEPAQAQPVAVPAKLTISSGPTPPVQS